MPYIIERIGRIDHDRSPCEAAVERVLQRLDPRDAQTRPPDRIVERVSKDAVPQGGLYNGKNVCPSVGGNGHVVCRQVDLACGVGGRLAVKLWGASERNCAVRDDRPFETRAIGYRYRASDEPI